MENSLRSKVHIQTSKHEIKIYYNGLVLIIQIMVMMELSKMKQPQNFTILVLNDVIINVIKVVIEIDT